MRTVERSTSPAQKLAALLMLAALGTWLAPSAARAESCPEPTEQLRARQVHALELPDCRAYEQVSPTAKNNLDTLGTVGIVQAAPAGGVATFFAEAPFPQSIGSAHLPIYMASRSPHGPEEEWSTQGLEALAPAAALESVDGVAEDVSRSLVKVSGAQAVTCEPATTVCGGLNRANYYVHDMATGRFELLAETGTNVVGFADATPGGSRILFETEAKLTPEANIGLNLYEWEAAQPPRDRVSLVGVLPGGAAPTSGSFAGPGGPAVGRTPPRSDEWHYYTQHSISQDGTRVFFSDIETGFVYMREPEAKRTVQLSGGNEPAFWRGATRDGSYVFYSEGPELYRFNVTAFEQSASPEPGALAEAREQLTSGAEGITGVLGISEADGSYVYFVAPGNLASNENGHGQTAETGAANMYEWHEGLLTFITDLPDRSDWRGFEDAERDQSGPGGGGQSSRVTPDGQHVLFSSTLPVTGYVNGGFPEFYLYDAGQPLSASNPSCVTCNPLGTPATHASRLTESNVAVTAAPAASDAFMTRNLSSNGRRVFFQTDEALVAGDANLQTDVYEWEAQREGSCRSQAQNTGCLYLISPGQPPDRSYFGDASADGSEAFFFTRRALAGQDTDTNADLYVARVDGGILGQNPPPSPLPCAEEEACRGPSSNTPSVFGTPTSATFSAPGNLAPSPPVAVTSTPKAKAKTLKCKKGFVKKQGKKNRSKCVRKRKSKKAKKTGRVRRASR